VIASAAMATSDGLARAHAVGLPTPEAPTPAALYVGIAGEDVDTGFAAVDVFLAGSSLPSGGTNAGPASAEQFRSLHHAVGQGRSADVALISVPGAYAASEAAKAIELGMHVMVFSDNVSIEDERRLKEFAVLRGVLLMGPDCGTAVLDGVPLGFANAVRPGNVAIVGSAGTGMQEVMCRLDALGAGVSQAIGCGGRDLSVAIGGITMISALSMLRVDATTSVVILVGKPPSPRSLAAVKRAAVECLAAGKLVVAGFVGSSAALWAGTDVRVAGSLAGAAEIAAELVGATVPHVDSEVLVWSGSDPVERVCRGRFLVALYSGGTLLAEAKEALGSLGVVCSELADLNHSSALPSCHVAVDLGDDQFTLGRPHPMIDPTERDRLVGRALSSSETAVVLVDVVLGFGTAADPVGGLVKVIREAGVGSPPVVVHVCGTERDPVERSTVAELLRSAGAIVANGHVEAVRLAASVVSA
jgi:FdrA protein